MFKDSKSCGKKRLQILPFFELIKEKFWCMDFAFGSATTLANFNFSLKKVIFNALYMNFNITISNKNWAIRYYVKTRLMWRYYEY